MNSCEKEMLVVLARDLHMLSLWQLARAWWTANRRGLRRAREAARGLAENDWLNWHELLARPISSLAQPLVVWSPDQQPPDFSELAARLHRRARASAAVTTVVTASQKTRSLFGRGDAPCRPRLTQTTHDLHVAEVFLTRRAWGFGKRQAWVLEDYFPDHWPIRIRPDALLVDQQGRFLRALEYGGDYSVGRLRPFHGALTYLQLAYEIW